MSAGVVGPGRLALGRSAPRSLAGFPRGLPWQACGYFAASFGASLSQSVLSSWRALRAAKFVPRNQRAPLGPSASWPLTGRPAVRPACAAPCGGLYGQVCAQAPGGSLCGQFVPRPARALVGQSVPRSLAGLAVRPVCAALHWSPPWASLRLGPWRAHRTASMSTMGGAGRS